MGKKEKNYLTELLFSVGVGVNKQNPDPWDIRVLDDTFYDEVLRRGSLGLGEAYMNGLWECADLSGFFYRVIRGGLQKKACNFGTLLRLVPEMARSILADCGHWKNSHRVGEHHYDAGNDLYELMLGNHMVYSCGYWKDAKTLDEAQEHKMRLICEKLGLRRGMSLLDIGCGFGELLAFAARHYGIRGVGVTISKEQATFAQASFMRCGLAGSLSVKVQDYRVYPDVQFDRIVSVGMFEHVGSK